MALLASEHGASVVTHDGEHYLPLDGAESVFDLPDHVAAHLLPHEGWRFATDDELPEVVVFDPAPRPEDDGRLSLEEALAAADELDDDESDESEDDEQGGDEPAPAPRRTRRKTS